MKGIFKDSLKGKSKLILAVPLILIIFFGIILYIEKSEAKASTSKQPSAYLEPSADSTATIRDKVRAYELEEKNEEQEEKETKDSQLNQSDIFFSTGTRRKEEMQREEKISRLQEDPYEQAVSQYNLNRKLNTHAFASRMTAQLNELEMQEAQRREQAKRDSEERYRKKMEEAEKFQHDLYNKYVAPVAGETDHAEEETGQDNQPAPQEDEKAEDYEMPSTPIYYADGKRYRRARISMPEKRNLIKAAIYGNQTVVNGSTVKMRLLEPVFAGGIEIPANTVFHGTAQLGTSRLKIKVENLRYGNYITPVNYLIYDMDAIEGLNLPNNLKAEATQRVQQGLVQNIQMPISSIGTMASEVTSAINATTQIAKQVIGQSLSQIKVDLKANYTLFLKEETQEDKKKQAAEDAELEKMYQQILLQKNEPKKKNYLKKIFDSL